ncbi:hypothetical protein EZS27_019563, partial [termite gut metagenome]
MEQFSRFLSHLGIEPLLIDFDLFDFG